MGMHGFRGVHRFGRRVTTGGAAPVISSVVATPQEYYTTVTWTTDVASSSQVEYGTTSSYGSSTTLDATLRTSHSVVVRTLASNTLHHFRVKSGSTNGSDGTFTTLRVMLPKVGPFAGLATTYADTCGNTLLDGGGYVSSNQAFPATGNSVDGTGTAFQNSTSDGKYDIWAWVSVLNMGFDCAFDVISNPGDGAQDFGFDEGTGFELYGGGNGASGRSGGGGGSGGGFSFVIGGGAGGSLGADGDSGGASDGSSAGSGGTGGGSSRFDSYTGAEIGLDIFVGDGGAGGLVAGGGGGGGGAACGILAIVTNELDCDTFQQNRLTANGGGGGAGAGSGDSGGSGAQGPILVFARKTNGFKVGSTIQGSPAYLVEVGGVTGAHTYTLHTDFTVSFDHLTQP